MARKNNTGTTTTRTRKPRAASTPKVETPAKECPFLRAIGADVFEFPATTEFFYRDKSTKDGLAVWSKQGERIYNRGYTARKALLAAQEALNGTKGNARKEAQAKVAEAQAKVDAAEAEGAFKYGRVARTHGSALQAKAS